MKLAKDEIVRAGDAAPLELFAQGIRSKETLEKYTRTLRQVTCEFLEEILEGTFEDRVSRLVKCAREEPDWTRDLLINLSGKLRKRTELPGDHADYLNPVSFGNYFKPLKKLFDMNDVVMQWKRIYATYPELDNMSESRGWTREEIGRMLRHTRDPMERALVLVLASSGMRSGGLDLNWGDMVPVYRVGGELVLDPGADGGEVACAMLQVYRGSAESYVAFITPEAHAALQEYGRMWIQHMGRQPGPKDPIFLATKGIPKRASYKSAQKRLDRIVTQAGLRVPVSGKTRRHNVPLMNGFRRFWNKTCKEALSRDSPLASLIRKEFMMGHRGLVSLDQNYFKTSVLELAEEYVGVVPDLTIDDAERLRRSNRRMSTNIQELEAKNTRIDQLEKKVLNLEKLRVEALEMDKILKEAKETMRAGTEEDANSLMSILRRVEACHRDNIEQAMSARDLEIRELRGDLADLVKRLDPKDKPPPRSVDVPGEEELTGTGIDSRLGYD